MDSNSHLKNFSEYFRVSLELVELHVLFSTLIIVIGCIGLILVYIHDRRQKEHAILRNYPVIGHLRYFLEYLGDFFRQYFFSNDREELPFNRAERAWVYRASKQIETVTSFGSTRPLNQVGEIYFVSAPFPSLGTHDTFKAHESLTFGVDCPMPYTTTSIFNISAMSYGSISKPAIIALTKGAKKAGCWVNTGEGGVSPYHLAEGCDLVVQIGTAKYGVRDVDGHLSDEKLKSLAAQDSVKMFEIKLSQGAKPGKGGLLPAIKVTEEIAAIRGIPPFQDSVSPNRHTDIANVSDLLNMVEHIREVTGKPVGCKFVLGSYEWLHDLCRSIHARGIRSAPDFICLDSADGGTGAAPQGLMDYMGIPIQESLPKLIDILMLYNLRSRIKVIASGKLITASSVAWALCAGADCVNSARGFMLALGCIQAMRCHTNRCPTGITSHDPRFQRGLVIPDKAERVCHYVKNMHDEIAMICHACGVDSPKQLCRSHVRIVRENGFSVPLSEIFPDHAPLAEYRT